ncbi:hypothetical protein Tco_0750358 [Tanacetum coccineum]|uniref:Uncharacterized protein n=1 Tax=Tanacetum coccineum TaxID=301880 RepID=A0ABQ4Z471_9ASTR
MIFASTLWWLWRFRNSVVFCSHHVRKSDIIDNIQFSAFSWLHHRGLRMVCNWTDWLMSPLSLASAGGLRYFEHIVTEKSAAIPDFEQSKPLHVKLKDFKSHLKLWYAHTKEVEANRKNCIFATLRDLDKKIDDGHATDVDRTTQINRMQELEDLEML